MNGRTLVIGGLGYLGGRIVARLAETRPVRIAAHRPAERWPDWSRDMDVAAVDLRDRASVDRAMRGVDAVVHAAGLNSRDCAADPETAADVNVVGTVRALEAAAAAGVRRYLYVSTVHVYGAPLRGRLAENGPIRPRHPYAWTRAAAENAVLAAAARGMETLAVRLSNAVGAPMDPLADCWMLLCHELCRAAAAGADLTLRGAGLDRRDFVAMPDATAALAHLLDLPVGAWSEARIPEGVVNVSAGRTRSTLEVAEAVARLAAARFGVKPAVRRREPEPLEPPPPDCVVVNDRLRDLGFAPSLPLEAGLDELLDFCARRFSPPLKQ